MSRISLSVLDLIPRMGEASFEEALGQAVNLAVYAEKWGYARYWAAEHHDMDNLSCASPEVLLSHIGARTDTIRLGSGAVLLPHYSPLKVAENFRMLSALYPGRIDLGVGRAPGGSAHTSMALSGNFLANVADMPNRVQALKALLNDSYTYEEVPVTAKPVPLIPPELWMLGTNVKSAAMAAEFGTGYVFGQFMSDTNGADVLSAYRDTFQPSDLLANPKMMVAVGVICAATHEEAQRLLRSAELPGPPQEQGESTPSASEKPTRMLCGTPKQVRERLLRMAEQYDCEAFLIFTPPVGSYEERLNSYRMLAEAVAQM